MSQSIKTTFDDQQLALHLGETLRQRRKQIGKTILQISKETDLSVSFISQVERGQSTPSIISLYKLAEALESSMDALVKMPKSQKTITRAENREKYSFGEPNLAYENLAPAFGGALLNACLIHRPAGHVSEKFSHQGEEFIYLLKGEIHYQLDQEKFSIKAGDTIHFDSHRSHSSTVGNEDSIELWLGTMPILEN